MILILISLIFLMLGALGLIILDLKKSNDKLKKYIDKYNEGRDEF